MNSLVGFGSLAAFFISAVGKLISWFCFSYMLLFHSVSRCNVYFPEFVSVGLTS